MENQRFGANALGYEQINKKLKESLESERLQHSFGTADTARMYAKQLGFDEEQAYLAGILHDCAKRLPAKSMAELAAGSGMEVDEIQLQNPSLLHSHAGAVLAKSEYGVDDEQILMAIKYHTTGRAGMGLLEKIIFLADLTEPVRDFEDVEEIREMAAVDFDRAVLMALDASIASVIKKGGLLHPHSIEARDYIASQMDAAT
ncbi:MAG: bis(5'-nucleosyl)-tetraphosphatase (symmetrical) YqeK [Eubacteriaceae bacterium]|nr:bis(5'-nucleosyl)-tetraphosphatase (symmetrical) YqeK [Eubacteriaceae bacterium]